MPSPFGSYALVVLFVSDEGGHLLLHLLPHPLAPDQRHALLCMLPHASTSAREWITDEDEEDGNQPTHLHDVGRAEAGIEDLLHRRLQHIGRLESFVRQQSRVLT